MNNYTVYTKTQLNKRISKTVESPRMSQDRSVSVGWKAEWQGKEVDPPVKDVGYLFLTGGESSSPGSLPIGHG